MSDATGQLVNVLTLVERVSSRINRSSVPPIRARSRRTSRPPRRPEFGWTPPSSAYLRQVQEAETADLTSIPSSVSPAVVFDQKPRGGDQLWINTALKLICVPSLEAIAKSTTFTVNVGKGQTIGVQRLVETGPADRAEIRYSALRDNNGAVIFGGNLKPLYFRIVGNRVPIDTDQITLVLKYDDDALHVRDYYFGAAMRPFPGVTGVTPEDVRWWYDATTETGHALAVTEDMIVEKRLVDPRRECPWSKPHS